MSTAAIPSPICFAALAQRLAVILGGLRGVVAALSGRDHSKGPMVHLVWSRISRLAQRFEALVERLKAGRTTPPRSRAVQRREGTRKAFEEPEASTAPSDALRLPSRVGWLVRMLPEAAGYRSQLMALFAEPGMAELLAADPKAGRILRPLCRMLLITPEGALALPPVRRRQAPKAAGPETTGPQTPKPKAPTRRERTAEPASGPPPPEPPSAIAQVWAALLAHTAPGAAGAVTPSPRARKPPW